jgi:hypothetical protein
VNAYGGTYSAEGIMAIADALRVNGALTTLNLSSNFIGGYWDNNKSQMVSTPEGPKAIADALLVNGSLTECNVRGNFLDSESAKKLAKIGNEKGIMLFGIKRDQKEANFARQGLGPADAILISSDLVIGGLTALDLSYNGLRDEGVSAVCEAIQSNKETKLASLNFRNNGIGPVGANAVAAMVAVTDGLTSLNLSNNKLGDSNWTSHQTDDGQIFYHNKATNESTWTPPAEGLSPGILALAHALHVNGALTSLDLSHNQLCGLDHNGRGTYTAEGITAIADALRVNGALTVANFLGNHLDLESAKMLIQVAKQKDISLCGIRRDQTTADFSDKYLKPPDAILLASDLSQAVVTGALTQVLDFRSPWISLFCSLTLALL